MECSECKYFEYEEIWDGEEEHRFTSVIADTTKRFTGLLQRVKIL